MKKLIIFIFFLFIYFFSFSQYESDIGYRTTDVGAEFQWYPAGYIAGLHLGFNSKLHHSVQLRLGYNKANRKDDGEKETEEGGGWGGGLGYRYYFKPFPHKFFIGLRTDIWRLNIDWTEGAQTGTTKTWTFQPLFETGYTFFINDQAFLTASISNGTGINIKTDGEKVGQGFVTMAGISFGVRL